MRISILTLVIALLVGCDYKSAEKYFLEAQDLEEKQKFKEAIVLLDKAIEKDNKFIPAYINRAEDKYEMGDTLGAISDYEKVLTIDKKNTKALFNIGYFYSDFRQYAKAIEYYNKAVKNKGGEYLMIDHVPNDFVEYSYDIPSYEILYNRGMAYFHVDSLKRSMTDFQYCIKKEYMVAESFAWLGYIYLRAEMKTEACECFSKARLRGYENAEAEFAPYCK